MDIAAFEVRRSAAPTYAGHVMGFTAVKPRGKAASSKSNMYDLDCRINQGAATSFSEYRFHSSPRSAPVVSQLKETSLLSRMSDFAFASSPRTGADEIASGLFVAALTRSIIYNRAAGFFSSSALNVLAPGLADLFQRGGVMTLVTSPNFSRLDLEAIRQFYIKRERRLSRLSLAKLFEGLGEKRLRAPAVFGELLRRENLRVFIARPLGRVAPAIYHEKFAIFSDGVNALAASGSGNESALAFCGSFERFEIFRSWFEAERVSVYRLQRQFTALVDNKTDGLEITPY